MARDLNWLDPGRKVKEDELRHVEEVVGFRLPSDFSAMLEDHAGASNPDECQFRVYDDLGEFGGNFGSLLDTDEQNVDSIICAWRDLQDQLPDALVPIVSDGGGDYVLLDYRQGYPPSITYFAHEKSGPNSLIPLATNFSEFVDSLEVPEDL